MKPKQLLLLITGCLFSALIHAQTFTGTGGSIPDDGLTPTCFPVNVTGIGNINNVYGIASVCINITHTWDSDLEISLVSPSGTTIMLSNQNGGSGDNYTNTCFSATGTTTIANGFAPFTGTYLPDDPLGTFNNGQNANGIWQLCIQDVFGGQVGTLNSFSITFNNTPAPPPPVQPPCSGNIPAGNTCDIATPVCNFNGYCGNTSGSYTPDYWTELGTAFCGSIENNSFITFVASASTASFNVWVFNSTDGFGIQMFFYDGGCGSGAVNEYQCENQIEPSANPFVVIANGLTPGNTYYLMFDGYAGDICDYTLAPLSGVNFLNITPPAASVCVGESVVLTASGGNGTYSWTGAGLSSTTGAVVTATPTVTTTYTVTSQDPGGACPITKDVTVTITTTPDPPTVTTPLVLCQNAASSPLTATGSSLLWYTTATGGTGSSTAPTPSTSSVGSTTYYVTQTLVCGESVRVPLVVNIIAGPPAPTVTSPVVYCQNATATQLTATGTGLLWYTTATGGTGSATAPTPSTTTPGSTNYYVSQSGGCGEGPRATITVNITAAPAAPVVTSPVSYCQGAATTALTATGTGLLWYTTPTGGTGTATAPTPSSATVGSTNYYVSQTVAGCQGPRSMITVTILSSTPPPTATSPVIFCQGLPASQLTATGTGLLWYTTATGGTGSPTAPTPSTATAGTITYYVSQTSSCGESPRIPVVVNINPIPVAPVPNGPLSYCMGVTPPALTAAGSNLLWYTTATGGTGTTTLVPSTATVGTTTYYVSQTVSGCESPRAPIDVTITALPPAPTVAVNTFTYCQGVTATVLSATGSNLLWYTVATGGTGSPTAPVPSTTTVGTFIYYVSQTLICGESPRTPITVTVNPTPAAPVVTTPVVYCQGVAATALTANGNNLLWYTSATGGTGNPVAPVPSTVNVGNTNYYVSATTGVCEGPRANITVTVNVTPPVPVVTANVRYCQLNATTALTATGTNLTWYTVPSGGTGSVNAPVPSSDLPGTTIYYVSQTIGVCEGPRAAITVLIDPTPDLGPDQSKNVCFGDSIDLNTFFNTTGLNIKWTIDGTEITNPGFVKVAGTYTIEVSNALGCGDTATLKFTIEPPVVAYAGSDTIAVKGLPHQLFSNGGSTYLWEPAFPLDLSSAQNPKATLYDDQLFVVTAINDIGCSDKDTVFVKVYDGPTYYVPSAFTPNGDGLNDIFRAVPVGISYTEWFRVFNRLGEMVFSTNRWLKGWDGTYLNKRQPNGTYVWVIKGLDRRGKVVEMKGTVILIN